MWIVKSEWTDGENGANGPQRSATKLCILYIRMYNLLYLFYCVCNAIFQFERRRTRKDENKNTLSSGRWTERQTACTAHTSINNFQMDEIAFRIALARHERANRVAALSAAPTSFQHFAIYCFSLWSGHCCANPMNCWPKKSWSRIFIAKFWVQLNVMRVESGTYERCQTQPRHQNGKPSKFSNVRNSIFAAVHAAISICRHFY